MPTTKPKLTEADFQRAATFLKCEVAAIKAVAEVESLGKAFYVDGFPVILFERHKFRQFTNGKYDQTHPHLSNRIAGGYNLSSRKKFNKAFALDPIAAMKACSWGKFQLMGFNYKVCGFTDVGSFVDAMKESESRQLDAFCMFVKENNLAQALWVKDWVRFARGYNGPKYAKNQYDVKMAKAYGKFKGAETAAQIAKARGMSDPNIPPAAATTPAENLTDDHENATPSDTQVEPSEVSTGSKVATTGTGLMGALAFAWAFFGDNPVILVAAVILVLGALWYFSNSKQRATDRALKE